MAGLSLSLVVALALAGWWVLRPDVYTAPQPGSGAEGRVPAAAAASTMRALGEAMAAGDDAAAAAPAQLRRPAEVGEAPGGPAARLGVVLGPSELDVDVLDQPGRPREYALTIKRRF